ncbi:hypothetical protein P8452_58721 [Trifolium repens]|nr:hypothetical protein P8452_58721 [Trifolium repens]
MLINFPIIRTGKNESFSSNGATLLSVPLPNNSDDEASSPPLISLLYSQSTLQQQNSNDKQHFSPLLSQTQNDTSDDDAASSLLAAINSIHRSIIHPHNLNSKRSPLDFIKLARHTYASIQRKQLKMQR